MPDFVKSKEFWLIVATIVYPILSRVVPDDSILSAVEFQNILLSIVGAIIGVNLRASQHVEASK